MKFVGFLKVLKVFKFRLICVIFEENILFLVYLIGLFVYIDINIDK